ncbi:MAG: phenylacetate--CoA ligase [Defluviitaleaceae bacterium]|nr:phenylacetate--CoA ligase [Defluviitaleaceae bacterium]
MMAEQDRYWNETIEKMPREKIAALQSERLRATVNRVYTNVPHYRKKMQETGILPGDIKSAEDLKSLPFTVKDDLRETYPFGMFACPTRDIVRIHATSGTTGKQTVVGYTYRDIDVWAECMARCLVMAGATNESRVQVCYGYGLFTGGHGVHYGSEKLGALTIPASSGNTERQINMMRDFGTTVLCCTPSYALYIGETMREMGLSASDMHLKSGCFGAEAWSENMRRQIQEMLGLVAHDIYGSAEIMGPAVSQDCRCQRGLHIWEDCTIAEIIDPDTGETLPQGQTGELVLTTINKEGFPMIRYRTRDITSLDLSVCDCKRTHARMAKPTGRSDDMLIIRGVNVFPSQIESALLDVSEALPHYQIIVDRVNNADILSVEIEVSESLFSDHIKGLETLEGKIKARIETTIGVSCKVRLVEPKTMVRNTGEPGKNKIRRVIDRRVL